MPLAFLFISDDAGKYQSHSQQPKKIGNNERPVVQDHTVEQQHKISDRQNAVGQCGDISCASGPINFQRLRDIGKTHKNPHESRQHRK